MKTEIELRKRAVTLSLQGWKKSEIARMLQRSRPWVDRSVPCRSAQVESARSFQSPETEAVRLSRPDQTYGAPDP